MTGALILAVAVAVAAVGALPALPPYTAASSVILDARTRAAGT
ncbi:hypothetical protein ACF1BP_29905 [Streptomyces sp. NPDC014735]|nr:hypothetical protein [Streptomyces sp. CB01580]